MRFWGLAIYSAAHFWVDLSCALLLLGRVAEAGEGWTIFLLYNFFAFAVQMPIGLLCDYLGGGRYRDFAILGCGLSALAWAFGGVPAAVVAGLGNACFHVGGGLYALNSSENCGPLGVFVSPGAVGIFLGSLPSLLAEIPSAVIVAGLLLLGLGVFRWGAGAPCAPFDPVPVKKRKAWVPLAALFAVVAARALLGGFFSFPWRGELGLWLTLAVAGGKAAGGLLADRFGKRETAVLSLTAAAILFVGSRFPATGLLAVFAFQMTMPLTLWGAARLLRGSKGLAFGLLTFALFLGSLPALWSLFPFAGGGFLCAAGALCSLPLLLLGLREGAD